jgi:hypothetical protein
MASLFLIQILITGENGFPAVNSARILDFYRQYSPNTEPGEYGYLYKKLPTGLMELCVRIKKQLIHPNRIGDFPELAGMRYEDETVYSVKDMLSELVKRNPKGLVDERSPKERLRLSCRFHSLLLASILKSRGIPTRVRVGFADYLSPPGYGKSIDHWICEVWDKNREKWILVDPDLCRVDFDRSEFHFAGDVWRKVRASKDNPERYGSVRWWGMDYIKANVLHDLYCVMNNELIYWEGPAHARKNVSAFDDGDYAILDILSSLLSDVDRNIDAIRALSKDGRMGDVSDYPRFKQDK